MSEHEMNPAAPAAVSEDHPEYMPEGEEEAPPGVRVMAVVRWVLVGMMALAAVGSVAHYKGWLGVAQAQGDTYYCPMHPSVTDDHASECPICGMTLVKREAEGKPDAGPAAPTTAAGVLPPGHEGHRHEPTDPYACPMDPMETGQTPDARCPVCGMKLEAREPAPPPEAQSGQTAVPGLSPVDLSPERIQLIGMKTAKVKREALTPEIRTVGYVAVNEGKMALVQTRFSGWIETLPVARTGEKVKKGQVLATIYSPELLTVQQEYLNALRWAKSPTGGQADLSAGLAEDARRRLELLGIAKQDIAEIERTGQPVRAMRVRAPKGGYITRKSAVQGTYVQPGTELFEIAELDKVWVLADVYEYEVPLVRDGLEATLSLGSYPGEKFTGKVEFLYPTLDPDTRTLRIRLEFANPDLRLRPGMYGDVLIRLERAEGLVVPIDALVDTGEVQYVFVARTGGRFEPRKVRVGIRSGGKVQLLSGVSEGETVVTTANFLIDSESRLQAAISGQAAAPSGAAAACEQDFDKQKFPKKFEECVACETQHAGMGTMVEDCKKAIAKPWK